MTDTETMVAITPRMQDVINHMLSNPKGKYCAIEISQATGLATGVISPLLHKMEAAGWAESEFAPRTQRAAKRYFWFTPGSAAMLRKALK